LLRALGRIEVEFISGNSGKTDVAIQAKSF